MIHDKYFVCFPVKRSLPEEESVASTARKAMFLPRFRVWAERMILEPSLAAERNLKKEID